MDEIDSNPVRMSNLRDKEKSSSANDIHLTQKSDEYDNREDVNALHKEDFDSEFDKNFNKRIPPSSAEEQFNNGNSNMFVIELPHLNKNNWGSYVLSQTIEEKKQKAREIMQKYESRKDDDIAEDNEHHYDEFSNRGEYWLSMIGYLQKLTKILLTTIKIFNDFRNSKIKILCWFIF